MFLPVKSLSRNFVLELIESILVNNDSVFIQHPEHMHILRYRLMPLAVRFLSERQSFAFTVRVARILLLLLKSHLPKLAAESEVALSLLIHLLDTDASPPWKRAICMELFRSIYSEPGLIRLLYQLFDEYEGRKNILRDHMACLVRLAAEKPSLIGVSHQSTIPTAPESSGDSLEDQVALEAVGVAGVIGSPSTSNDATGISSQWSLLRTPYMETLDKLEAPNPPETYIYSLVLNSISAFSESIANFILPLAVAETKSRRKRRDSVSNKFKSENLKDGQGSQASRPLKNLSVPLNPLELDSHSQLNDIKTTAKIIDACWPAVLATSSTFLYAALDGDYYHNLVRAFQKLTHVAGLLRLTTPRDAFLTTLGKAAVPVDVFNAAASTAPLSPSPEDYQLPVPQSPTPRSPSVTDLKTTSTDSQGGALNTRNLLCLRALLNLGIALGPTLDRTSWFIILETLQHAELILGISSKAVLKAFTPSQNDEKIGAVGSDSLKGNFSNEVSAVRVAAMKLFEGTQYYPDTSLKVFLAALLRLSGATEDLKTPMEEQSATSLQVGQHSGRLHQNKRSLSIALGRPRIHEDELKFVLWKMGELTKANAERLAVHPDTEQIWDVIVANLVSVTRNNHASSALRFKSSEVLNDLIFDTIQLGNSLQSSERNEIQLRGFLALKTLLSGLYGKEHRLSSTSRGGDFQIHELTLETLKSILEECGDSITAGWDLVFGLVSSVFETEQIQFDEGNAAPSPSLRKLPDSENTHVRSARLVRTAYDCLQLVATDFLALLPATCLLELVETFSYFTAQKEDFNISLATTTSFWNISDFIRGQIGDFDLEGEIGVASSENNLAEMARAADTTVSKNALWVLLLLKIVHVATDSRTEIRNSAIQTVIRILDHYGEQMPPYAWHLCLHRILLVMAESVQSRLSSVVQSSENKKQNDEKAWVETAVLVTKGLSDLIANFFDSMIQYPEFHISWSRLLQYLSIMLQINVLEVETSIFSSFAAVLSRVKNLQGLGQKALEEAWVTWATNNPAAKERGLEQSNQKALSAFLDTYKQLYRLLRDEIEEGHIARIMANLQLCVWNSVTSRYSSDLERPSEVQKAVIECLTALCTDKPSSQSTILRYLGEFTDSALVEWSPSQPKEKPTFVAFSKASLQLLSWYIREKGVRADVLSRNTVSDAMGHVVNPILNKYDWPGRDCEPHLWQVATTTALDVLQVVIPSIEEEHRRLEGEVILKFWSRVIDLTNGILSADEQRQHNPPRGISDNEGFDIDAFKRLLELAIPSLGSSIISDKIRRDFAFTVFKSSLVYPSQRIDQPLEHYKVEPLRALYSLRRGCTVDPLPTSRSKLAYLLVDTLFDLVSAVSNNNELTLEANSEAKASYVTIAKSTSPYLILRCGLALKSYIADQPLRGLMPQPVAARKELLYLLQRLDELRSEPAAIPAAGPVVPSTTNSGHLDAGNNETRHRKHLGWIYPLVVKGVPIAGRDADDREILEALTRLLESVAGHAVLEE